MNKQFLPVAAFLTLLLFASCEKVINVDLKDAGTKLVVEGNISDIPGLLSHHVRLSQSVPFNATYNSLPVKGALVIVNDINTGIIDTLEEVIDGDYVTQNIEGITGHTYKLSVNVGNNWYYASSTMPKPVPFDSLYTEVLSFFGTELKQVIPVFTDPVGEQNYYRFLVQVNDSALNEIHAWDDKLTNGKKNSRPINIDDEDIFRGNDTVYLQMRCIDKGAFDFYNTFYNATGDASTPSNPMSNVSNGALGAFSAYTLSQKSIVFP